MQVLHVCLVLTGGLPPWREAILADRGFHRGNRLRIKKDILMALDVEHTTARIRDVRWELFPRQTISMQSP
jgi:hypothetical protein